MHPSCLPSGPIARAFRDAIEAAKRHRGATAPNPTVGCVLLDREGTTLAVGTHAKAGAAHAEAAAIETCRGDGTLARIDTVVVTLEPCNHLGRTPPCSEAILATPARRVWIGVGDPDPGVPGGGAERLRAAGIVVHRLDQDCVGEDHAALLSACRDLIAPFAKQRLSGRPWVALKQALDERGSMIPPSGHTTFTSDTALTVAHRLRKRADAILTGSGTILADDPSFTVRRIPDHLEKRRILAILDRRGRVPHVYREAAQRRGFEIMIASDLESALDDLGRASVLEVLVEAGPSVAGSVLSCGLWDEHVLIRQGAAGDTIEIRRRHDGRAIGPWPVAADMDI